MLTSEIIQRKNDIGSARLGGALGGRPSPVLKWAGGKGQLLHRLLPLVPSAYGTYIEPFFGGGALFFAVLPERAVISDSNPDLVHFYTVLRDNVNDLIDAAKRWKTDEKSYYAARALRSEEMDPIARAARTLYLNRTCFNGLYRVNKRGQFNVPFGSYDSPRIVDAASLRLASAALASATILSDDYLQVLRRYAKPGDFIFVDPPYVPIAKYADFKRYTRDQFHDKDHVALAEEIQRLKSLGCSIILTNSNANIVRTLYRGFSVEVAATRRNISCNGATRTGEDLIITANTAPDALLTSVISPQVQRYPSTRFMGSKEKLLGDIWRAVSSIPGSRVLDLFSGTGCVAYMFKCQGKQVTSNDYMAWSLLNAKSMLVNGSVKLSSTDVDFLTHGKAANRFVRDTFTDLYFSPADSQFIDLVRCRIQEIGNDSKADLARAALMRACLKKRARGIFTYTGIRYDDGRRDMQLTLRAHFLEAVKAVNGAIFDNGLKHSALRHDALDVTVDSDIVYIDPPYFSPLSDNDYVRRYHFVEGLACDWEGLVIQEHTKTKKFKSYYSAFSTLNGAIEAFNLIFRRYAGSSIIVSYSSNSLPDRETILRLLSRFKKNVEVIPVSHRYSFGNQGHKAGNANNKVEEYLFVAT